MISLIGIYRLFDINCIFLTAWISLIGICRLFDINCIFLIRGLDQIFKENFIEFSIDFQDIENLGIRPLGGFPVLQMGYNTMIPCGFLTGF